MHLTQCRIRLWKLSLTLCGISSAAVLGGCPPNGSNPTATPRPTSTFSPTNTPTPQPVTPTSIPTVATPTPVNNSCANAVPVGLGTFTGSNVGATTDGNTQGSCATGGGNDVWWRFTAPRSGTARFKTCGSSFDTILNIFDGCGGAELNCNDEGLSCGNVQSALPLDVTLGRSYLVRVAGKNGATGSIQLTIEMDEGCAGNDDCACATDVGFGTFTGNNASATTDGGTQGSCATGGTKDVWWRFTAPQSGTVWFKTCGSSFDTILNIFDECGGTELNCNNEGLSCGNVQSALPWDVTAGEDYLVRVAGVNGATGDIQLTIQLGGP